MSRDKQNIKTSDWLIRGIPEEQLKREKREAIKEAEAELRNKQIEEMAKVLNECCNEYDVNGRHIRNKCNPYDCEYWSDDNHCCCSYNTKEATALYNAGYVKASDLAEEIFAEIDKLLAVDRNGEATLDVRDLAELKKKYTVTDSKGERNEK